jgi:hypothetical protein
MDNDFISFYPCLPAHLCSLYTVTIPLQTLIFTPMENQDTRFARKRRLWTCSGCQLAVKGGHKMRNESEVDGA